MITVTPITMSGVFAPLAEDFMAFKRAQGYKYLSEAKFSAGSAGLLSVMDLPLPS